jgi:hypothetical protein
MAWRRLTLVSLDRRLQVRTLASLLATVTLDVGSARLAHGSTVLALRDRTALLVDMLERAICRQKGNG